MSKPKNDADSGADYYKHSETPGEDMLKRIRERESADASNVLLQHKLAAEANEKVVEILAKAIENEEAPLRTPGSAWHERTVMDQKPTGVAGSVEGMLVERAKRYGVFRNHAALSQLLKGCMVDTAGWENLADDQREALDMIVHKIARILNGDPSYVDSWTDIAGYATLVEKRLGGKTL